MYKILNNILEMDDYALQRLKYVSAIEYIWYKLWGNTRQGILPSEYTQVDYIESTGTQYIDTNFTPNSNTKYDINIEIASSVKQLRYFISAGSTYRNNIYCGGGGTQQASAGYGSVYMNTDLLIQGNTKYNLILNKNLFYVDGVIAHTFTKETFNNTGNAILFARASDLVTYSDIKLYDCKIYDSDILVRNFIPCYRNSDNEVGLYDTVTKTFYTNQGTGSFAYGNVVPTIPTPSAPVPVLGVGDRTNNLFDEKIQNALISSTGKIEDNPSYDVAVIPVTANEQYSFAYKDDYSQNYVVAYFSSKPVKGSISYNNSRYVYNYSEYPQVTVTIPTGITYIALRIPKGGTLMVNLGTVVLPYEPYGYKIPIICDNETKIIYLNEPLHKIGDYADILSYSDHNVTRKIKKLVLTGTENFEIAGSGSNPYFRFKIGDYNSGVQSVALCSHFEQKTIVSSTTVDGVDIRNTQSTDGLMLSIRYSQKTTVSDFKQWLVDEYANGTPVIIWYVLATPETEEIHAPEILADRYTSITVDTYIQPSQVDFTTKGGNVPQPSLRTANAKNAANELKRIEEDNLKKIALEEERKLEEKEDTEEPIEKEESIENKK